MLAKNGTYLHEKILLKYFRDSYLPLKKTEGNWLS